MIKILIVEDDPAISLGLKELLQFENYEIIDEQDGRKAAERALNEEPSLILLDINLPSMNGFEVCRKLRENGFVNPIIMLTSRGENIDRVLGLELGANDYVEKPFNPHELLARIHSQLRSAERLKQDTGTHIPGKYSRKLLAVMFTDMKDYARKMNTDEKLALKLLGIHNELIKNSVSGHHGVIVENVGDAFVVTFQSAVKSVECAVEIQRKLAEYNRHQDEQHTIEIRIGIHLGDIIVLEDGIKGDTVNIAARIQQHSLPGSIAISENVYAAIRNKVKHKTAYTGEYNLKNITGSLKIYTVEE